MESCSAFRSDRKAARAEGEIWFLHMDGTPKDDDAFQIPGVGGMPIFSPDNRWIAFTKKTPPPPDPPAESPFEKQLDQRFKGKIYDWMNIRFDQRGYLADPRDPHATPPAELYVVAREGGAAKQLTHLNVDVTAAAWRPDSGALALIADSHQRDEYSYERADLWIVDLDRANPPADRRWIRIRGPRLVARWKESRVPPQPGTESDSCSPSEVRRGGGHLSHARGGRSDEESDAGFRPDSRARRNGLASSIYFRSEVGGDGHLFRMAASGGTPVKITKGERSIGGFSFSEHFDRIAYAAQDPTHPAEAFSSDIDGSGEVRLSRFNDKFLSEVDLNPAERIHFPSKDGTLIEGWIVKPPRQKHSLSADSQSFTADRTWLSAANSTSKSNGWRTPTRWCTRIRAGPPGMAKNSSGPHGMAGASSIIRT